MRRRASVAAAVASAACFGTLAVLAKYAYEGGAQPLQLLAWRFAIATLLLGTYAAVRRPGALRVPRNDLVRYAVLSLAGYGAASICFFFALRTISASVAAILLYTYPAIVALVDPFFGGPTPSGPRLAGVALAFAGCVLVLDPFSEVVRIGSAGVALGLGAAIGYANFSVLSARLLPGRSRLVLTTYMFGFTAMAACVAAAMIGTPLVPSNWAPSVWPTLAAILIFPTLAAVLLYLAAIRGLGAGPAALLSTFEPLFTIAFAGVLLGDRFAPVQWMGASLVLGGVLVAEVAALKAGDY